MRVAPVSAGSPAVAPLYPVGLVVAGRRCLVVGGGEVAARKAAGLVECGADVTVVAPVVGDAVRALGVRALERPYERGDVDGCRLVVTATDDPAVNARVAADADAAGVWVNAADDPANCSFTLPAVLRRGPVTVSVATDGRAPALASWLRDRLAGAIGPDAEVLAEGLARVRAEVYAAGRSTERLGWKGLLERLSQPDGGGATPASRARRPGRRGSLAGRLLDLGGEGLAGGVPA